MSSTEWIVQLKEDLVRINSRIKKETAKANEAIERLKLLEAERELILEETLGEDDEQNYWLYIRASGCR